MPTTHKRGKRRCIINHEDVEDFSRDSHDAVVNIKDTKNNDFSFLQNLNDNSESSSSSSSQTTKAPPPFVNNTNLTSNAALHSQREDQEGKDFFLELLGRLEQKQNEQQIEINKLQSDNRKLHSSIERLIHNHRINIDRLTRENEKLRDQFGQKLGSESHCRERDSKEEMNIMMDNKRKMIRRKNILKRIDYNSIQNFKFDLHLFKNMNDYDGNDSADRGKLWINDAIVFSSHEENDEKMIAIATSLTQDDFNCIKVVRLKDQKVIHSIENAHKFWIISLAVLYKNGEVLLASGSSDGNVKLWRVSDRIYEEIACLQCADEIYKVISYTDNSTNKQMLACGLNNNKEIELWDVETKKRVHILKRRANDENHDDDLMGQVLDVFESSSHQPNMKTPYIVSSDINSEISLWCLNKAKYLEGEKTIKSNTISLASLFSTTSTSLSTNKQTRTNRLSTVDALTSFEHGDHIFIGTGNGNGTLVVWKIPLYSTANSMIQKNINRNEKTLFASFDNIVKGSVTGIISFLTSSGEEKEEEKDKIMMAITTLRGFFYIFDVEKRKVIQEIKCNTHRFYSLIDLCKCRKRESLFVIRAQNKATKRGELIFLKAS